MTPNIKAGALLTITLPDGLERMFIVTALEEAEEGDQRAQLMADPTNPPT